MSTSQYRNNNLLYRPSISIWTARIKDKDESAKVAKDNGAKVGVANVYKALLPDSPQLKAVTQYATAFRQWIYDNTSAWDDGGWRIGRVTKHMDFMAEVGDRIVKFNELVEEFIAKYATARENARFTLATLFDESDYPGVNEVRSKFGICLDCQSLPNTEDFRVVDGLAQEEVDRLVNVARTGVEEKVSAAMQEAFQRLFGVVEKMASTLEDFGDQKIKKFNNTLVSNIADIVAVMPALNILGDPKLDALAAEAKDLTSFDPDDLRKDDKSRKAAIEEARALMKKFSIAATVNPSKPKPVAPSDERKPSPLNNPAMSAPYGEAPAPAATSVADSLRDMMGDD